MNPKLEKKLLEWRLYEGHTHKGPWRVNFIEDLISELNKYEAKKTRITDFWLVMNRAFSSYEQALDYRDHLHKSHNSPLHEIIPVTRGDKR